MATGKVTSCFSSFSEKEFSRIENAAQQLAEEAGRKQPLNVDYANVVKGILGVEKAKLAKLVEAAWAKAPAPKFSYVGEKAQGSDKLPLAQELTAAGFDADTVRTKTGWFQGLYDGKWRREISDRLAKWKVDFKSLPESKIFGEEKAMRLGDVLEHEALFNAYPELADVKLVKRPGFLDFGGLQGSFDAKTMTLQVTPYAKDPLSTVLHEMQHWIQTREGFAEGGNESMVLDHLNDEQKRKLGEQIIKEQTDKIARAARIADKASKIANMPELKAMHQAEAEFQRIAKEEESGAPARMRAYDAVRDAEKAFLRAAFGVDNFLELKNDADETLFLSSRDEARFQRVGDEAIKAIRDGTAKIADVRSGDPARLVDVLKGSSAAYDAYRRIAGEIEARDVQARQKMTDEERAATEPYSSEKIAKEDAIVVRGGEAQSESREGGGSSVARLLTEIAKLNLRLDPSKITVVERLADLPPRVLASVQAESPSGRKVQAFVHNGRAYFIASNIRPGTARAVFLHEVGTHMGLEELLTGRELLNLVGKIRSWAAESGTKEAEIARRAVARVANAQVDDTQALSELIAYFVEEAVNAGIDPTAQSEKSEIGRWMAKLMDALKAGLKKLGLLDADGLTAQDVVDMAYGAAHLAMTVDGRADSGTRASVQAAKADRALSSWAEKVAKLDRRTAAARSDDVAPITMPTPLLKMVGMYRPLIARVSEVRHALEHPETSPTLIAQLPELLKSPRLVSRRADGSLRFVLDARDAQARPYVAAFAPVEIKGQKAFVLKTLYAHDSSAKSIMAEARDGRVVYASDEGLARLQDLLPAGTIPEGAGTQPSTRQAQGSGANVGSVLTEAALAKFTAGDPTWRQETRSVSATESDVVAQGRIKFSVDDDAPREVKRAMNVLGGALTELTSKGALWASFTKDLAARAAKVIPSAKTYVDLVAAAAVAKTRSERAVEAVLDGFADLPAHERGVGPGSVNAFLHDSTFNKKWGFKPEYHADVQVDPEMEARFKRLSPEAQKLVQDVFRHGNENLQRLRAAVMDNVTSEHDAAIRAAEALGNAEKLKEAQDAKVKSLKDYERLFSFGGNWPYAPLKRFGNQVVVARSQALLDAMKANDTERVRELQQNGDHYHVEFTETKRQAQSRRAELEAEGNFALVQDFEKDGVEDAMYGGRDTLNAFRRLRALIENSQDEHLSAKSATALKALMTDLHLTLLGEASARQSERNRTNVAGADKDMMRAFATQGRATAHFIASLETSGKVIDALNDMKTEADAPTDGRRERRDYYNELLRRHVMGLEYSPSPLVEKAMATTSLWMLLTSPAYFLTNATQPFAMSLPVMAGKHGYGASVSALSRAYRDILPLLRNGTFKESDYSKLPADVVEGVQKLADGGFIDISLEQDLGRWRSLEDGPTRHLDKAVSFLRRTAQGVEAANRLSTAIAALRLARAKGMSSDAAVAYAGQVIYDTHGDYTGFNSPRVMRSGVGRLLTQFRKFQLIQISLFAKMARESIKGATPEDRRVARAALGWSLGHMMALGGLLGMPGAQAVGWVLRHVFGDDDEPDNPELTLRRLIGDEALADLIIKGVPKLAGVDLSGRVGAGGMLSLLPYGEVPTDRKSYEATVVQALGPFLGGLLPKFADGISLVHQGDWAKGMEQLMPTGFSNLAKGVRLTADGMTQRNGDLVMGADEISVLDGAMQALGLPTNTLTDRSFRADAKFKSDAFFKERATRVQRSYVEAYRSNDASAMAEARQEWAALQEARVRGGYSREPLSNLLKAPAEQRKREKGAVGGVEANRQNKRFVQELDELS